MEDGLLEGQLAYYRARAGEYDEWFLRKGRHDRGPEWNRGWFSELEEVRRELDEFGPTGDVLELACGTGLWTTELARHANTITAVDASPEVLDIKPLQASGGPPRDARPLRPGRPFRLASRSRLRRRLLRLLALSRSTRALRHSLATRPIRDSARRTRLLRRLPARRDMGRKGTPRASPPGPYDAKTAKRWAGVQDRQDLLRPGGTILPAA